MMGALRLLFLLSLLSCVAWFYYLAWISHERD